MKYDTFAKLSFLFFASLCFWSAPARGGEGLVSNNKLLYMYRLYYLPFAIDFREGRTQNDVLPFRLSGNTVGELISGDELSRIDRQWEGIRESWRKRSLLLNTPVKVGEKARVTNRVVSHKISLTRGALDTLTIPDRIQINDLMKSKSPDVQADFKQLRFLKSFMEYRDENKFNLFLFSASWCSSCREYRSLLESYLKSNPQENVVFHSVVIDDPQQQIFKAKILGELFPHPERYSHDSIPKFLAVEKENGKAIVYEEGEALSVFYERYLKSMRGFMKNRPLASERELASPTLR